MIVSRRELFSLAAGAVLQVPRLSAQEGQRPVFRVKVDMVVLSFTVTDSKNHYINGLKPVDFRIYEDGILQKLNTFGEGTKPPLLISDDGTEQGMMRRKPQVRERDDEKLVGAAWRYVTADPAFVAGVEDACDRERTVDVGLGSFSSQDSHDLLRRERWNG